MIYKLLFYFPNDETLIPLNPGAAWFIPTQDQFYKAAYYEGDETCSYLSHPIYEDNEYVKHLITHYGVFDVSVRYESD
ncbi:MAG: hypothetical protein ACH346_07585 [Chthoniobacterales bacterium]